MILFSTPKKIILLLLLPICYLNTYTKNLVTIIGTGYVGLVTGACLAEIGNDVICTDVDFNKIKNLKEGIMPIYEQGLSELVARNVSLGRLSFTNDIEQAIQEANIIFIAVGTPMGEDGRANMSYVNAVVETISENINTHKIIVTKSTVPVGTGKQIRSQLEDLYHIDSKLFSIASNPEFLREGLAVYDCLHPDRLIIGTDSDDALIALCEIYEPFIAAGVKHVLTDIQTAEMIKYAANAFLSVKVSYINEIANICDELGADGATVALAMGLDHRISPYFLNAGPGFGGSCFPKDSQALVYIAQQHDLPLYTVQAALDANKVQQQKPVEKLAKLLKDRCHQSLKGKTVAVLGLAFKANTDDVRYSPAITTIELLLESNVNVRAYDPVAMSNMRDQFPGITYCETAYETAKNADAIIIMTDWDEFKQMDLSYIKSIMKQPVIVDARNIINPEILKQLGFVCDCIGQSHLCKNQNAYIRKLVPIPLRKCMTFNKFR